MNRFVILAAPRTGSNLLCTLLDSHPQILCHHEVFNPEGIFVAVSLRGREAGLGSTGDRDRDPLAFLKRVWETGAEHDCVGFKWTRGQDERVLGELLKDTAVRKIVLQRRNRVKMFVSEKIAQKTQQWEVYSTHELRQPRPRVRVDKGELLEHISINADFYINLQASLDRTPRLWTRVWYETLFDLEEQVRLLSFLDVTAGERPLKAASVKQNSMDLRDSIENFADLKERLRDSDLLPELLDRGM